MKLFGPARLISGMTPSSRQLEVVAARQKKRPLREAQSQPRALRFQLPVHRAEASDLKVNTRIKERSMSKRIAVLVMAVGISVALAKGAVALPIPQ